MRVYAQYDRIWQRRFKTRRQGKEFFDSLEGVYKRILPEAFAQNIAEYVTPRLSATF